MKAPNVYLRFFSILECSIRVHSFLDSRSSAARSADVTTHLQDPSSSGRGRGSSDTRREALAVSLDAPKSLAVSKLDIISSLYALAGWSLKHQKRESEQSDHHTQVSASGSNDNAGLGYSVCLFGAVALQMGFLYLANHDDPGVVLATWRVSSMTLSIFSAILAYLTIRAIFVATFAQSPISVMIGGFVIFFTILVLNEVALYALNSERFEYLFRSGSALGSHLLGFSAAYAFGDLQRAALFGSSLLAHSVVIIIAIAVFTALVYAANWVHLLIERSHQGQAHEQDVRWERETELMESEAMSLCMGYLLIHALSHHIRGFYERSDSYDAPADVTQSQATCILVWAIVFAVMLACLILLVPYCSKLLGVRRLSSLNFHSYAMKNKAPLPIRLLMTAVNAVSVATGWCLLLWAEWQLYASGFSGPRSAAVMVIAFGMTLFSFGATLLLEKLGSFFQKQRDIDVDLDPTKIVRSLTLAVGIVIGFAWEKSFSVGLKNIARAVDCKYEIVITSSLACVLILIVTPVWALYVFPMVQQAKERAHRSYISTISSETKALIRSSSVFTYVFSDDSPTDPAESTPRPESESDSAKLLVTPRVI